MEQNKIYNTDCLEGLKTIADNSIDCCVTSPPYFGLRDYGHEGQIGLEETPEMYVDKIVQVFEEVRRVLKKEGTLWLNLGDSYSGSWGNYGGQNRGKGTQREIINGSKAPQKAYDGLEKFKPATANKIEGLKPKDLIGIPWMVAFALRSAGWYLRQDIIWHKPNPMPESVTDRCTKAHEYIFLMSKGNKYYYDQDAIKEESIYQENRPSGVERNRLYGYDSKENNHPEAYRKSKVRGEYNGKTNAMPGREAFKAFRDDRNKRSVWTITTKPYSEAHFATFPEDLIVDCIKAGCPERKYTCNCCGFDVNLHESNTIANETVYKELQRMRNRISGSGSLEQGENVLYKKMQFGMDGKKQGIDEGVDDFKQGIQDDCCAESSKQNTIRLHDGASDGDGEEAGEILGKMGGSPSQGQQQIEQQNIEPSIITEKCTRQTSETTDQIDLLSALWEENKSFGACPKCTKGVMIGKRGIILDCFMGAGTTALVARKLNRNFIGFELNEEYIRIANNRLRNDLGMFQ
jgi:DNA modification methylase